MWPYRQVIKDTKLLSTEGDVKRYLVTLCDVHWLFGERNHAKVIIETPNIIDTIIQPSKKHSAYQAFSGVLLLRMQSCRSETKH